MRRLFFLVLVLLVTSVLVASASTLQVEGGVLQVFRIGVEVDVPTSTTPTPDSIDRLPTTTSSTAPDSGA
jgi:hypothetical protein